MSGMGAGRVESNNGDMILRSAEAGHGIALLPHWLAAESLAAGRTRRVLNRYEVTATDFDSWIQVLYPSRRFLPSKVRLFVELFRSRLDPAPWQQ